MALKYRNLIVFDHPYTAAASENEPHNRSFTAALCKSITQKLQAKGQLVDIVDLHADGFDPVMHKEDLVNWRKGIPMNELVADYQRRMMRADRIIFMFPIWWELMPAMTKGFIDKVYAKNILYTQDERGMRTKLPRSTEVVVVTVMNTPIGIYKTILGKPIVYAIHRGTFFKTGIAHFKWVPFSGVSNMSPQQRDRLIERARV